MAKGLMLFFLLAGTSVVAGDDGRIAMGQGMISMICTQTLYECAEVSPNECTEMVRNAVDSCPVDELFKDVYLDLPRDIVYESLKEASETFSRCFNDDLQIRAKELGMPTKCIDKALTASAEAKAHEYRQKLETLRRSNEVSN